MDEVTGRVSLALTIVHCACTNKCVAAVTMGLWRSKGDPFGTRISKEQQTKKYDKIKIKEEKSGTIPFDIFLLWSSRLSSLIVRPWAHHCPWTRYTMNELEGEKYTLANIYGRVNSGNVQWVLYNGHRDKSGALASRWNSGTSCETTSSIVDRLILSDYYWALPDSPR